MSAFSYLSSAADKAKNGARQLGLPVARFEQFQADTLEPLFIQHAARYAIPFVRRSGVRITRLEAGRVDCRLPLKGNVNHIGTMYAGALFTLAEFPVGPLMLATYGLSRFVPIVTSVRLEFIKACKSDATVTFELPPARANEIESDTLAQGECAFTLTGDIVDAGGDVVARSHADYLMRPRRK